MTEVGQYYHKPKEHCGVLGILSQIHTRQVIAGLKSLQHRGQESSGLAYTSEGKIKVFKGMGLVDDALKGVEDILTDAVLGHVRYSTSGTSSLSQAQPMEKGGIALAFNGTITNYYQIGKELGMTGKDTSDTEVMLEYIYRGISSKGIYETIRSFMDKADGGYSVVILTNDGKLIAFRDSRGIRPLVMGVYGSGYVVASEDSAIRRIGGYPLREVKPGEVVILSRETGIESYSTPQEGHNRTALCSFEYIYFSRPDSHIGGNSVYLMRQRLGKFLGMYHKVIADVIIPVPDSGRVIALGYAEVTGIPLAEGLIRNPSVRRTFITSDKNLRSSLIEEKFSVVEEAVKGKRIVLIDDSIVRGNTMRVIIKELRDSGAKEVHVRIGSPRIRFPCYMGIDFPTRSELVGYGKDEKEISKEIGADSLEYLSVEELRDALGESICDACFSGNYPLKWKYRMEELEGVFGGVR